MILPVLDILAGHVVRGIEGRRAEYRPLTPESDPLTVARGFRDRFGLTHLYLADLDAIAGSPPAVSLVRALVADGFSPWIDAGLRFALDAEPLLKAGAKRIIAGLETLDGPDELERLARRSPTVVFSLDLKDGVALGSSAWPALSVEIVDRAIGAGVTSVLALDLTRVGVGAGLGTEELCREIRRRWPAIELLAGGGVRGRDDLATLRSIGVDHVLVASALHDGRLTLADVKADHVSGSP